MRKSLNNKMRKVGVKNHAIRKEMSVDMNQENNIILRHHFILQQ